MLIETLDKVKILFSKVTENNESNDYRQEAHLELLHTLKDIISDDVQCKEMFSWLRNYEEKDKVIVSFLKKEIFKIKSEIRENPITKNDLLLAIERAVEDENTGEDTDGYENLMECVEHFVDSDSFVTIEDIFNDLTIKIKDETNENVELDLQRAEILAEIIFYVISNIYSSDVEDGHNIIKASTIFCIPIALRAKNSIVQTPDVNLLSKVIKDNLLKRNIIKDEKNIEIGTSLYNISNMRDLNCENLWNLHNSILFDYEIGLDYGLRSAVQKHNGETSIVFCFLTILSSSKVEKQGVVDRANILEAVKKSFKDVDLWDEIGNEIENVYTSYKVYEPKDCMDVITSLYAYKDMTKFRVVFNRHEKNFDLIYLNVSKSNDLLIMFIDKSTGLLNSSYLLEPGIRQKEILLEMEDLCNKNDIMFYKHKYPLNKNDLDKFNKAIASGELIDVLSYLKNSVLVDREWKSWLNIDSLSSNNTLH